MKSLICLLTLAFATSSFAIETKLEGAYEINTRSEECASAFEISVQNECLVMEYGAAAAREFCRLNKGPKTEKTVVTIKDKKYSKFTTITEALFADVLTVSETIALKNRYGVTVKRTTHMATYSAAKKGLVHRESTTVFEAMNAPAYNGKKCQYKVN
ncbi:MAG: hypothetical protein CME70_17075 [Halobacteriovorax sp.]|nr:hypothetical protein [Halobacteriovorax sp.]|tara:strand:+ start:119157 stop:119627 length:471 start_codon:yes stop_codon:yes gene_type:complete